MKWSVLPVELIQFILSFFSFPYAEVCHTFDSFSKFCCICFAKKDETRFALWKNIVFEEVTIKRPLYSPNIAFSNWITESDVSNLLLLAQWNCSLSIILHPKMDQCSKAQKLHLVHLLFFNKIFAASITKWHSNPFLFTTFPIQSHWKCSNLKSLTLEGTLSKEVATMSHTNVNFTPLFHIIPHCSNLKSLIMNDTTLALIIQNQKLVQQFPTCLEHLEIVFAFPVEHLQILLQNEKLNQLKSIKLRSRFLTLKFVKELVCKAPKLETISVSDIDMPVEWFSLLHQQLPQLTSFESIYSKPCDISALNPLLKEICLWNCTIHKGWDAFAFCKQLKVLQLTYLRIGCDQLYAILFHCQTVQTLYLDGCTLDTELIRFILRNEGNHITNCSLLSCDVKNLTDRQLFVELVANNTTLTWLHVDLELITSLKFLNRNSTLKGLVLGEYKEEYFDFKSDWTNSSLECLVLMSLTIEQVKVFKTFQFIPNCLQQLKCLVCECSPHIPSLEECLLQQPNLHVYFLAFQLYAFVGGNQQWECRFKTIRPNLIHQIHTLVTPPIFDLFDIGKRALEHHSTRLLFNE